MPATIKVQMGSDTDARLARNLRRKMKADFEVPDERIATQVVDGYVMMEGVVARDAEKRAAEACVSKIKGVRGIANKIIVGAAAVPGQA